MLDIVDMVKDNYLCLEFINPEVFKSKYFAREVIKVNGNALKFFSEDIKNDPFIVNLAIDNDFAASHFIGSELTNNIDYMTSIFEKSGIRYIIDATLNTKYFGHDIPDTIDKISQIFMTSLQKKES
jgi:hypothetical protein